MIDPSLKIPSNLRRTTIFINRGMAGIEKGALGYLIRRTTIHNPPMIFFISLCEQYEFNVTDLKPDVFENV